MRKLALLIAMLVSAPVAGEVLIPPGRAGLEVVILGEVHDNPRHHRAQASAVATLRPAAIVFEMLSREQAGRITPENRRDRVGLGRVLGWEGTTWPDFSYYYPIIAAGEGARIYGAGLTRAAARAAFKTGIVADFGPAAGLYGLDRPLAASQLAERVAYQRRAHCDALPEDLLPKMVALQRLRDAYLARAVVAALDEVGRPVVVITGNGHARKDRGLAVYLARARPDVSIYAVGLSEDGRIDGVFDRVVSFAPEPRPDPCLAFEKGD